MNDRFSKIAVVGIGAQLPSGCTADVNFDYQSFFQFLLQKGEAYEPVPKERFNTEYIRGNSPGSILVDRGAFLKDLDQFDFLEFGITTRDARLMNLSTRKLIEVAFMGLQDSGIDYRGKNVGCYMAGIAHDMHSVSGHDDMEATGSFAYAPATIANRVSYHLDLRGPSVPVDTACSSSLYATHLAVQALRNGECDAAVVGGCQLNHRFTEWLIYTQGGILSPDGKCKPFDISADGFGRAEGAVAIVLKPLEDALRDNDHVYATILGTGVNSCGSLAPVSAPVASAQRDAMHRAFKQTDRRPQDVDFIELHATGTASGDPTEANWVGDEFKRGDELLIGSVKGNVGHLEITAFLTSLCKVCGIFETGLIPPNVNFSRPNPAIHWSEYSFRVPTEVEQLKPRSSTLPPLVAMTSSGIGGANGHCVLEGAPKIASLSAPFWLEGSGVPALFIASGLSPRSASAVGESLTDVYAGDAGVAKIFGRRARSMTWRSFAISTAGAAPNFTDPVLVPKAKAPIVFVFSGQGTQHFQMGRDLFKSCAPFRASVLELDKVYEAAVGTSLIHSTGLFTEVDPDATDPLGDPWPIAITLPALTLIQLALVDTLAAAGVAPDVVVGHSAGETAVLSASGAASKAMALEIAIARGRAMALVEEAKGTMAAVSCSPDDAMRIIADVQAELGDETLAVGCYNTPGAVTLSGAESHIDLAVKKASAEGIFARKLRTRVPVHSSMMELCRAEFEKRVADVFSRYSVSLPTAETYSTKTGALWEGTFDEAYYWDGTVGPVRFTEAITAIAEKHKAATYVEIGPHPVLTSYMSAMTAKNTVVTCPLRRQRVAKPGAEVTEFLTTLGKLVVAGHNVVDFDSLYNGATFSGSLPRYPFAPKTVPWRVMTPAVAKQTQRRNGPLNYPQLQVNAKTHPGLAEHIIKGEPIMPAAGYIEMALEFGARELYDVEFHSMLPLSSERPVPVNVRLEGTQWSISSASSTDYSKTWPIQYNRLHATGFLSTELTTDVNIPALDLDAIRKRTFTVDIDGFYKRLATFAPYGPMYRRIRACHIARGPDGFVEALTEVRGADKDIPNLSDYRFHPAIMDAAIHVMVHPMLTGNFDPDLYHLPARVAKVRVLHTGPLPATVFGYATLVKWTPEGVTWNSTITDEQGIPLVVFEGILVAQHGHKSPVVEKRYDVVYTSTGLSLSKPAVQETPSTQSLVLQTGAPTFDDGSITPPSPSSLSHAGSDSATASTAPSSNPDLARTLIFDFVRGEELKLQPMIAALDVNEPISLLFIAEDGVNGHSAFGFTRALRKEYRAWTVRVAVFDKSWDATRRIQAARELLKLDTDEVEMKVDADGTILVPRVELADPPSTTAPLSLDKPWKLENGKVVQLTAPQSKGDDVVVQVNGVARIGGLSEFIGKVEGYSHPVVGISAESLSSHLEVHKGTIIEMGPDDVSDSDAPQALGLLAPTIVALAVGTPAFTHAERLKGTRVLIVDTDGALGAQIQDVCSELGVEASLITTLGNAELAPHYLKRPNVILSGKHEARDLAIFRTILAPRGRTLLWNHPTEGISGLGVNDPWSIGDAVRSALEYSKVHRSAVVPAYVSPSQLLPEGSATVSASADLFDPSKSYLLVGGIGSLGIHIALWMYENGARHLVLTSRSGASSLVKAGDWVAQRMLAYLRTRHDLELELAAVDAASKEDMRALVSGIDRPLGGCMLVAVLLRDRMFASQTEETFETVIRPKINGFEALEHAIDMNSLDFIVTFSSISGLFGNPGQTNYATANAAMTGMTRKYKNAFALVCPAINDSKIVTATDDQYLSRLRHMSTWGMTGREVCHYLGDGIRKLRDGPVWQYIPDFDWRAVQEGMGVSKLYAHLVPEDANESTSQEGADKPQLLDIVCRILGMKAEDVSVDVPLTGYGLDSLSAASMSFALRPLLAVSQLQLLADLTLKDLQTRMDEAATNDAAAPAEHATDTPSAKTIGLPSKVEEMESVLARLSEDLTACAPLESARSPAKGAVVITGTTGSVGAHALAHLLELSKYTKVYALVRASKDDSSAADRQKAAFEYRGLDTSLLSSSRLTIVESSLEKPSLGISKDLYEEIRTTVSHIIVLGWPINLESSLSSFDNALQGLRGLINLSKDAREFGPVTLLYGSSFGMFRNYTESHQPKEVPIEPGVAVGSGYTESKWIAERLLQIASERNILQSVVVRIGQLTGGVNGAWNVTEWLPSMVRASVALRCLPQGQGVISWLPVDTAAAILTEMMETDSTFSIFHLRHPNPISWSDIMGHFSHTLSIPTVPYVDWLSKVTDTLEVPNGQIADSVAPAIRLLHIFQSVVEESSQPKTLMAESNGLFILLGIEETLGRCGALRDPSLPQLSAEDVRKWVGWWKSVGVLA